MEKEKISNKTPEQQRSERHQNLMNTIIAETFSRHSRLSEEEFLEKIGFKDTGKAEDEAVRIAKFNALIGITRKIFNIEEKVNFITGVFRTYLLEEGLVEEVDEAELKKDDEKGE